MAERNVNRLKNTPKEPEAVREEPAAVKPEKNGKPEKPAREKQVPTKPGMFSGIKETIVKIDDVLQNEKFKQIAGLILTLGAVYLLIAFTSYIFTWEMDSRGTAEPAWTSFFANPELEAENWLGKLGAYLSHLFIHNWFGYPSFLFVIIAGSAGIKLLFKANYNFGKICAWSMFFLVWTSLTLAGIFIGEQNNPGGIYGFHLNGWLNQLIGRSGTFVLDFFSLLGFLVIAANVNFSSLPEKIARKKEQETPFGTSYPTVEVEDGLEEDEEEFGEPELKVIPKNEIKDEPQKIEPEEPGKPEKKTPVIEEIIPPPVIPPVVEFTSAVETEPLVTTNDDGVTFEIEKTPDPVEEETNGITVEHIGLDQPFDPTLELSSYKFPTTDLLEKHGNDVITVNSNELNENKDRILKTLQDYNIEITKIKATIGPTVTLYEIVPAPGVRISKIKNLEDDIALSLSALGIRIIAPIPGKGTIGIEVPNQKPEVVSMRSILESEKFRSSGLDLPIALGKTISNEIYIADLAKMPHLLMAGSTGQGKSVGLNAILVSLLYKKHPSQIKFVLVDPKKVELTLFSKIERHFLAKLPDSAESIITDTKKVINTLNSLCIEMDQRYDLLKDAQVRNLREYNAKFTERKLNPNSGHRYLPYIVLVVDEFADLIMTAGKEVETPIARLAQLARAIGIHLIIATQRPSVNIITGTIKANFPARIAFRVTSKIDSRTILDTGGADQLIGRGDMLLSTGNDLVRLQCPFVDTPEVEKITEFIGAQRGYPSALLLPEVPDEGDGGPSEDFNLDDRDALFDEAARIIVQHQQGSASLLQRRLKLGYNRAGRIIDQLEAAGIIGPFEGSKAREVLVKDPVSLEQYLSRGEKS